MADSTVPLVECYLDGEETGGRLHVSNGQHASGKVFSIRSKTRRTSSLCTGASFDRAELDSYPLDALKTPQHLDGAEVCSECRLHVQDVPEEAFMPPTNPLELSDARVQRAKTVIARLEDELGPTLYYAHETRNSGLTPHDFVDEWREPPQEFSRDRSADELETMDVPVGAIVGSRHPDRFIP